MKKSQLSKSHNFRLALILTAIFFLLFSIPNLVKGFYGPTVWGQYLWFVSYEHGFIKRGLLGTIFQFLFADYADDTQQIILAFFYSALVCLFFTVLFCHLVLLVIKSNLNLENKTFYLGLVCLLSITPLWPTLAYTTAYPDLFVFVCCYLGLLGFMYKNWLLTVFVITVGVLIHEAFLFVWLSVFLIMAYEYIYVQKERKTAVYLAFCFFLPLIGNLLIAFYHNNEALTATIDQINFLSEKDKQILFKWQFNQSVLGAFSNMIIIIFDNFKVFLIKAFYFLLLPCLFCIMIVFSAGNKINKISRAVFYFLIVFSPLSILFFAWDLSRFLSYAAYGATLLLIYILSKNLITNQQVKIKIFILAMVLLSSVLIYVRAPLVYAYFNMSSMVGVGQYIYMDTFGKDISSWIVENDFKTVVNKRKEKNRDLYTKTFDGQTLTAKQSEICFVCDFRNDYVLKKQLIQICSYYLCDHKPDIGIGKQLNFREYQRLYAGEYVIELHYRSAEKDSVLIGEFEIIANGRVQKKQMVSGTNSHSKVAAVKYVLNKDKYNATLHLFDLYINSDADIEVEKLEVKLIQ